MRMILNRKYKKPFYFQKSQSAHICIKMPLIPIYIAYSLNKSGLGYLSSRLTSRLVLFSDLKKIIMLLGCGSESSCSNY